MRQRFICSLIYIYLTSTSVVCAQNLDLGNILNGIVGGALRPAPRPYPRQYYNRGPNPRVPQRNDLEGQDTSLAPDERRTFAPLDRTTTGIANIGVGEFKLGGYVRQSALPQTFKCEASHDFPGFSWCRRKIAESNSFNMTSILLSPEGRISYVSKYIDNPSFKPGEIGQEIERLSDKFRTSARIQKPPQRPSSPKSVIAVWGEVRLKSLGEEELQHIAEGRTAGMGLFVDFLGDTKSSARQGLPVYRIEGGPGFFWIANQSSQSSGNLRFGAVNATDYNGQSRLDSTALSQVSAQLHRPPNGTIDSGEVDIFKPEKTLSQSEVAPTEQLLEMLLMKARPDLYTTELDAVAYYARQLPGNSKQCDDLRAAVDDEVSIGAAVDQARKVLIADLEKVRDFDPNVLIKLSNALPVGEYQSDKSVISFNKKEIKGSIVDVVTPFNWALDRREGTCLASPSPRALRRMPDTFLHNHRLTIKVVGGDRVKALNVDPETAKAIIRDIYNNPPRLSISVRVGLIGKNVVGKIISAQATRFQLSNLHQLRPTTETVVIQNFPRSVFADIVVTPEAFEENRNKSSSFAYISSSENHLKLNAIRLKPQYLADNLLMRRLPSMIESEQSAYRAARITNERPPNAIFELNQIAGRDPVFAANELLPQFRRIISQAAAENSSKIRSGIMLSGGGLPYDFAKSELSLSRYHPLLLNPQRDGAISNNADGAHLNISALKLVNDHILYQPSPIDLEGERNSPLNRSVELTLQEVNVPAVALDRLLLTPNLPIAKGDAEAMAKALRGNSQIRSIVNYDIDGISSIDDRNVVLTGRVTSVSVIGPDGRDLARYDASQFPAASVVTEAIREQKELVLSQENAKLFNERAAQESALQARKLDEANRVASLEQAKRDKEKQIVAAQERPEGAFGPAVAHIQLGMPMVDAEQIVRQSMKDAAIIVAEPGSWGFSPSLVSPKVFVSSDAGTIVSLTAYGDKSPRVVAISQRIALPTPPVSRSDLVNILIEKNGTPSDQYQNTFIWGNNLNNVAGSCKQFVQMSQKSGFVLKAGTLVPMRGWQAPGTADQYVSSGYFGYQPFEFVDERNAVSQLRECPTTKIIVFDLRDSDPYMKTAVVDGGWLAKMIEDKLKVAEPAGRNAIKALLDQ